MNEKRMKLVEKRVAPIIEPLTVEAFRVATAFLKINSPEKRKEIIDLVERYSEVSNDKTESAS